MVESLSFLAFLEFKASYTRQLGIHATALSRVFWRILISPVV